MGDHHMSNNSEYGKINHTPQRHYIASVQSGSSDRLTSMSSSGGGGAPAKYDSSQQQQQMSSGDVTSSSSNAVNYSVQRGAGGYNAPPQHQQPTQQQHLVRGHHPHQQHQQQPPPFSQQTTSLPNGRPPSYNLSYAATPFHMPMAVAGGPPSAYHQYTAYPQLAASYPAIPLQNMAAHAAHAAHAAGVVVPPHQQPFAHAQRSPLVRNMLLQTSGRQHPQHRAYNSYTRQLQQNHQQMPPSLPPLAHQQPSMPPFRHPMMQPHQHQTMAGGLNASAAAFNATLPPAGPAVPPAGLYEQSEGSSSGTVVYGAPPLLPPAHIEPRTSQESVYHCESDDTPLPPVHAEVTNAAVAADVMPPTPLLSRTEEEVNPTTDITTLETVIGGCSNDATADGAAAASIVSPCSTTDDCAPIESPEMESEASEIPSPPRPSSPFTTADIQFGFGDDCGKTDEHIDIVSNNTTQFWDEEAFADDVVADEASLVAEPSSNEAAPGPPVILPPSGLEQAVTEPPDEHLTPPTAAAAETDDTPSPKGTVALLVGDSAEPPPTSPPAADDDSSQPQTTTTASAGAKTWSSLFKKGTAAGDASAAAQMLGGSSETSAETTNAAPPRVSSSSTALASMESNVRAFGGASTKRQNLAQFQYDDRIVADVDQDARLTELFDMLTEELPMNHRGPTYLPRGLCNTGNWCYTNAVLQALMACPPFFHLMRRFSNPRLTKRSPTSTPVLDALATFINEFIPPTDKKGTMHIGNAERPVYIGTPIDPDYIYKMAKSLAPDQTFKGLQEDAEEFLLCLLNRVHDELLAVVNSKQPQEEEIPVNGLNDAEENADGDDEWQRVGPTKRAAPITRQTEFQHSLLSRIFVGELKFSLRKQGAAKNTANIEPFFVLPLEIQDPQVHDLNSALMHSLRKEFFKTSGNKTANAEVNAQRSGGLQTLPPVLIVQFKYFVCTADGSITKLDKPISYNADLTIDRDILTGPWNSYNNQQRHYKLFAVVFHHGERTDNGHYTADVFHAGVWIDTDDSRVDVVEQHHATQYARGRVPYLLFYRRCDLMRNSAYY